MFRKHNAYSFYKIVFSLWVLIVLILSVIPVSRSAPSGYLDKVAHLIMYLIMTVLCINLIKWYNFTAGRYEISFKVYLFALIFAVIYGIVMELIQAFISWRDASVLDAVFNFIGAALGMLFIRTRKEKL